jgi:phosphoglycolate phosphatase
MNVGTSPMGLRAILFDLDGTLLDTAPDMVATLNQVKTEEREPPVPYATARAHVSNGVRGLLRLAFGELTDGKRDRLHHRFLEIYATRLAVETALFPGMAEVLASLDASGIPWGVVTNKPGHLTEPLLIELGLRARCACVVSGDTVANRKPHPEPLLHALALIRVDPDRAAYVGDAERDVVAGRAAGMQTIAASYGYIPPEQDPASWGADLQIAAPADLLTLFAGSVRSGMRNRHDPF